MAQYAVPAGQWTTGLCGCCGDCKTRECSLCWPQSSLCCACWCPCIEVGRIAEIVTDGMQKSGGACCIYCLLQCFGLGCLYSFGFRQRLRQKYVLPAKPCGDCCTHCFCECCAVAQEARELTNRGWELKRGFAENYKAMQVNAQPAQQAMRR